MISDLQALVFQLWVWICLMVCISTPALGGELGNYHTTETYQKIFKLCRLYPWLSHPALVDTSLYRSLFMGAATQGMRAAEFSPMDWGRYYVEHGLSVEYADLATSPEFEEAVSDCTGGNRSRELAFKVSLMAFDIAGSVSGFGMVAISYYLASKYMTKCLMATLEKRLGLSTKGIRNVKRIASGAAVAVPLGIFIKNRIDPRQPSEEEKEEEKKRMLDYLNDILFIKPSLALSRKIQVLSDTLLDINAQLASGHLSSEDRAREVARRDRISRDLAEDKRILSGLHPLDRSIFKD